MKIVLDPVLGLAGSDVIDEAGMAAILALRSKFGQPRKDLTDPSRYIDLGYYNTVTEGL